MLIYKHETPSLESIRDFFYRTDNAFDVPLSQKVNIEEYTLKLYTYAEFFVCYDDDSIVGMICCYMNRPPKGYISHVCVSPDYQGRGVFKMLYSSLRNRCLEKSITEISLEVGCQNFKAQLAYVRIGFIVENETAVAYRMHCWL